MPNEMSSPAPPPALDWPQRRAQLVSLSSSPALQDVRRSLVDLLPAASTAHQRLSDQLQPEAISVDLAHAVSQSSSASASSSSSSTLQPLRSLALTERDFPEHERGIKEQGAGSFVSICRCRLNPRRLFAVKSVTKAIARKAWPPMEPLLERKLLSRATEEEEEAWGRIRQETKGKGIKPEGWEPLVPRFFGSYQTGGSLNIVMEYFREGDAAMYLDNVEAGIVTLQKVRSRHAGALLKADLVKAWGIDMTAGIAWLHEQGFLHRDIKPSNFLISPTGHLKMCDFGTAAPFSTFSSRRHPTGKVRRVLNSHNDEAGTTDYISPEIVEKVVMRARKRNWQRDQMCEADETEGDVDESVVNRSARMARGGTPSRCPPSPNPRRKTDPDGPGDYGPEIDWWALGISLFEMAYGRVPFEGTCNANGWGAAAQQDEILNAEHCLKIPDCNEHGREFVELLKSLLCGPEKRLGRSSSDEVKKHPFFSGANWEAPYSVPAPWVSPLEPERPSNDPSPSLLHSPRPQAPGSPSLSTLRSSFNYSALNGLTSGDVPQFPSLLGVTMVEEPSGGADESCDKPVRPGMATSISAPELSQLVGTAIRGGDDSLAGDNTDASNTVTASRSSSDVTLQDGSKESGAVKVDSPAETLSGLESLDLAWVGFTHLPSAEAFEDAAPTKVIRRRPANLPLKTPKQPVRFVAPTIAAPRIDEEGETSSPEQSPEGPQPVASTPYTRPNGGSAGLPRWGMAMPTPLAPALMTPAVGSAARSLHRRAIESCARAASNSPINSRLPSTVAVPLQTPQRKTSMPNLGSTFRADAQAQHSAALLAQTPASAAQQPLAAGFGTVSRRNARLAEVAARAISETPSSHNSSALRHMAEKEAWGKMMEAVQQSVRKPSVVASMVKGRVEESERHARAEKKKHLETRVQPPSKRSSAPSTLPPIVTTDVDRSFSRSPSLGSEASSGSSPLSARLGFGPPSRSSSHTSLNNVAEPSVEAPVPALQHLAVQKQVIRKRSARQLLLRAQERTTPTKPARCASPLLTTTFDELSISRVAQVSAASNVTSSSSASGSSSNNATNGSTVSVISQGGGTWPTTSASSRHLSLFVPPRTQGEAMSTASSNKAALARVGSANPLMAMFAAESRMRSSSLGGLSRPVIDMAAVVTNVNTNANASSTLAPPSTSGHRMKRRESREMLSQFRRGIDPEGTGNPATENDQAGSRARKALSVFAAGSAGFGGPVASPSLPSLPDAFGSTDAVGHASTSQERNGSISTRRASMVPLRSAKSFANLRAEPEASAAVRAGTLFVSGHEPNGGGRAPKSRGTHTSGAGAGGDENANGRMAWGGGGKPIKRRGTLQHLSHLFESHEAVSKGASESAPAPAPPPAPSSTLISLSCKEQAGPLSIALTSSPTSSNSLPNAGEVSLTTQRFCSRLEKHRQSLGEVQEKVDRVKALVERFGRVGVE